MIVFIPSPVPPVMSQHARTRAAVMAFVVSFISMCCVVAWLRGCRVAGLRGCGVAGLRGCGVAGLRGCGVAGLRGCVVTWLRGCVVASLRRCGVAFVAFVALLRSLRRIVASCHCVRWSVHQLSITRGDLTWFEI